MALIDHGKMIHDTDTGRWIPKNEANRDYRKIVASGRAMTPAPPKPQRGPTAVERLVQALRSANDVAAIKAALIERFGG